MGKNDIEYINDILIRTYKILKKREIIKDVSLDCFVFQESFLIPLFARIRFDPSNTNVSNLKCAICKEIQSKIPHIDVVDTFCISTIIYFHLKDEKIEGKKYVVNQYKYLYSVRDQKIYQDYKELFKLNIVDLIHMSYNIRKESIENEISDYDEKIHEGLCSGELLLIKHNIVKVINNEGMFLKQFFVDKLKNEEMESDNGVVICIPFMKIIQEDYPNISNKDAETMAEVVECYLQHMSKREIKKNMNDVFVNRNLMCYDKKNGWFDCEIKPSM